MLERVTHIIEPRVTGMSALAAVAALCRNIGDGGPAKITHRAVVLGGTSAATRAERAGLRAFDRLAVPGGVPQAAARAFQRLLVSRPAVDLLVCWSAASLALAWLADHRLPRTAMFTAHEPSHAVNLSPTLWNPVGRALFSRTLRRAAEHTPLAFATATLREAWSASLPGASAGRVLPLGIDASLLRHAARAEVRGQWAVRPDESVVIALGEPERCIDASTFGYHCGVTSVAGARLLGVVPSAAFDSERGLRFTERHAGAWRLAIDDRPIWELLPGCDAAYWVGGGAASHSDVSLRWAAAAGLPIVATDDEPARTLLASYPGARLVPLRPTRLFTRAMIEVFGPAREQAPPFGPLRDSDMSAWVPEFDSHLTNLQEHARV
jgi:hypothetical protein